jgi:hypothetical protein
MTLDPTPEIVQRHASYVYATILAEFPLCTTCSRPMITNSHSAPWPVYVFYNAEAQRQAAGWGYRSHSVDRDGEPICQDCAAAGKATFICALCSEERTSSEVAESIGDPAEHLCNVCYTTRPAKEWAEKLDKLHKSHRWDYD